MDYFFNGVINHDENIVKNEYLLISWYKMETFSKVSKLNHFVPLLKKIIYINSAVTQSVFGMIGRKYNLIFLLFVSFQLLPKISSLIKTVQIFLLYKGNSDRMWMIFKSVITNFAKLFYLEWINSYADR